MGAFAFELKSVVSRLEGECRDVQRQLHFGFVDQPILFEWDLVAGPDLNLAILVVFCHFADAFNEDDQGVWLEKVGGTGGEGGVAGTIGHTSWLFWLWSLALLPLREAFKREIKIKNLFINGHSGQYKKHDGQ